MRYLDPFRDPQVARALAADITRQGEQLAARGRRITIMEVCGSHTMAIARYGIRALLPENVVLLSGPGCPVCVTPPGYIDAAIELAQRGCHVHSFGDMINVPGTDQTLGMARATGGAITACYSPEEALLHARRHPDADVVFLAIGFETTLAPLVALLTRDHLPQNLSLLTAFKLIPPVLQALRHDPDLAIDAFLCPPHVSAIIGSESYRPLSGPGGLPCIVAGFEPLDILLGIRGVLQQLIEGRSDVENQYARVVRPRGNRKAQRLMHDYLEPIDATWRGLGTIRASGLALRPRYAHLDAQHRFDMLIPPGREPAGCACGAVIKGSAHPRHCPHFGTSCTPASPIGPCMVSAEGSCAAAFRYGTATPPSPTADRPTTRSSR
jgi:hydrogenase expression/formation protein HypD